MAPGAPSAAEALIQADLKHGGISAYGLIEYGVYKEYIRVLSKIIFYLLYDIGGLILV